MVVDENMGRSLKHPGAVLHQALGVIDHRVVHLIRIAPASVQVLVRQTVTIAVDNRKPYVLYKDDAYRRNLIHKETEFRAGSSRTPREMVRPRTFKMLKLSGM